MHEEGWQRAPLRASQSSLQASSWPILPLLSTCAALAVGLALAAVGLHPGRMKKDSGEDRIWLVQAGLLVEGQRKTGC